MARRARTDSVQEKAVSNGASTEMFEALKVSRHQWHNINALDLHAGHFIVTMKDKQGQKVLRAEKVREVEWSRHLEWCKVNNKYVYTFNGLVEVLFTAEEMQAEEAAILGVSVETLEEIELLRSLFPEYTEA